MKNSFLACFAVPLLLTFLPPAAETCVLPPEPAGKGSPMDSEICIKGLPNEIKIRSLDNDHNSKHYSSFAPGMKSAFLIDFVNGRHENPDLLLTIAIITDLAVIIIACILILYWIRKDCAVQSRDKQHDQHSFIIRKKPAPSRVKKSVGNEVDNPGIL